MLSSEYGQYKWETPDNVSNDNQLTQIRSEQSGDIDANLWNDWVRHVQINFCQHSTYIQIVFWSKVSFTYV